MLQVYFGDLYSLGSISVGQIHLEIYLFPLDFQVYLNIEFQSIPS
jgi:hypothetical protein